MSFRPRNKLPRPRLEPLEDRTVPAIVVYTSIDNENLIAGASAFSDLEIADDIAIQDLDVRIDLPAPFLEELSAFLISPDGTRVELFSETAAGDDGLTDTRFDDEARRTLSQGSGSYTGRFRPSGSLADFDGESLAGTWRLEVIRDGFADEGIIGDWSLAATVDTAPRIYASEDVPLFIDDNQTIVSAIVVPDNFLVSDIDILLDIEHTFVSDLSVSLIAPDGTSVELFSGVGSGGQNFEGTILDEDAALDIESGSAPFNGRFRPTSSLLDLSRTQAQGTWRLEITDDFAGDTGTLNFWSLTFTPGSGELLPDLQTEFLNVDETEAFWGDSLNIRYGISNVGDLPNDPSDLVIVASADAIIDDTDLVLARVPVSQQLGSFNQTGGLRVTLPGAPLQPPPGFPVSGPIFIGLLIDPDRLLIESEVVNNANRGVGIDTQPLTISGSPGSIRGTVWEDLDGDSIRDPGEMGLNRVRVFVDENSNGLYDLLERTQLTDADGNYSFVGLRAENFRVMAVTREGEVLTAPTFEPDRDFLRADFANGNEGFTSTGINRVWTLGDDLGRASFSIVSDGSGISTEEDAILISSPIDLVNGIGTTLTFDYFLDVQQGADIATVGVLVNGVETILARNDDPIGGLTSTADFRRVSFDLSAFSGQTVQVFFRLTSETGIVGGGWFVSAPVVSVPGGNRYLVDLGRGEARSEVDFAVHRPADLVGTAFTIERSIATWGDAVSVQYSVTNRGTVATESFEVELRLGSNRLLDGSDFLLGTLTLGGLAAGETRTGTTTVVLPGAPDLPPLEFLGQSRLFVGTIIDPAGAVNEFSAVNNRGQGFGRDLAGLTVVATTAESNSNDTPTAADSIELPAIHVGELSGTDDRDFVRFTLTETGRLLASVQSGVNGLDPSLTLFDSTGRVLVESRHVSADDPSPSIDQHLLPGDYFLAVSSVGPASATGRYRLQADFIAGPSPVERINLGSVSGNLIATDFEGDGVVDLLVTTVASFFPGPATFAARGNGDGSFARLSPISFDVDGDGLGEFIFSNFVADVNGDGFVDLISILGTGVEDTSVAVRFGNGDGTFRPATTFNSEARLADLVANDFDGDGRIDLVGRNSNRDALEIFLGNGDGTFRQPFVFGIDRQIRSGLKTIDVNRDGNVDLVVEDTLFAVGDDLRVNPTVFLGNGDGTFRQGIDLTEDQLVEQVTLGDVNGDGNLDLLTRDLFQPGIRLRLGNGGESFDGTTLRLIAPTVQFSELALADVNGDGKLDLIASVADISMGLAVFLGNDDGTFGALTRFGQGISFTGLQALDLDGDGFVDLFGSSIGGSGATILFNNRDGTFRSLAEAPRLTSLTELKSADLNGDGNLDLVGGNQRTTSSTRLGIRVVLGNGDGTFREPFSVADGLNLADPVIADFDGDGRLDLAGVDSEGGGIVVALGNGDGNFRPETRFAAGDRNGDGEPDLVLTGLIAGDFNGDGILDLTAGKSNRLFGSTAGVAGIALFLGRGDGRFADPVIRNPEVVFQQLAAADVNGDGDLDLVSSRVAVLLGRGDGTFENPRVLPSFSGFTDPSLADLDRDGNLDIVTGPSGSIVGSFPGVGIFYGRGDGTFEEAVFPTINGLSLFEPTVGDFNDDGILDLAGRTSNFLSPEPFAFVIEEFITVLLGTGNRTFGTPINVPTSIPVDNPITGDFNGDGKLDFVSNGTNTSLIVALGNGEGAFIPSPRRTAVARRAVPIRTDIDADGRADLVVVNTAGDILLRRGLPGVNLFSPAEVINPTRPALEVAVLRTASGLALAASNAGGGMTVYSLANGTFTPSDLIRSDETAVRIRAVDLNGDGLDDLITADRNKSILTIHFQNADGSFGEPRQLDLGTGTNGITFANLDGRNGLDILTVNRSSGDISVFYNDASNSFSNSTRFRAGLSVQGLESVLGTIHPVSSEEPIGLSVGDFTGDGILDVVVVERAARQLRVLPGDGFGGLGNPSAALSSPLGTAVPVNADSGQLVGGDFNRDGRLDLVIVAEGSNQVLVYGGSGTGTFTLSQIADAGNAPTGVAVDQLNDDNRDGRIDSGDFPDLLIGNGFGDVLTLLGNGDGTFRPFVRSDQRVPFVATDLDGDGDLDVVLAQQARDLASSSLRNAGTRSFSPGAFALDGDNGLIGPGDIEIADLDGINGDDLIFANTGSNNVLVYLRRADGSFAESPLSFFAGTSPADLHLNDLNNDGLMDLVVANQGSNDVSVLFGSRGGDVNQDGRIDGQDLLRLGPRLDSGGVGPNAVTTMDVTGDGVADILATNGLSGTITTLPGVGTNGVGTGSFLDTNPTPMLISPSGIEVTRITPTGGIVLTGDNRLQAFNPLTGVLGAVFTPQAGRDISNFQTIQSGGQQLIFTVNRDGTGSVLAASASGFAVVQNFQTTVSSPSDLQVFAMGGNQFEIVLTDAALGSPTVLNLDLTPQVPIIVGFDPVFDAAQPILDPFVPDSFVEGVLDQVDSPGGQNSPFALVVTLVTSFGDDANDRSSQESIDGLDPFTDGSVFGDLDDLSLSEDGTVQSAGTLALVSLETVKPGRVEEDPIPGEETLKQFISGFKEEIERLIADGVEVQPPAPPAEPNPAAPMAAAPVARSAEVTSETLPTSVEPVASATEVGVASVEEATPPSESEEQTPSIDAGTLTLAAALTLSGVYLGGHLPGLWYRPAKVVPGLRVREKKRLV